VGAGVSVVGYARVSTGRQDNAGQVEELKAAGCGRIYADKASGAEGRRRPQLAKLIGDLAAEDLVIVVSLDRLGRSTHEIWKSLASIGEAGAAFRSLREPWADTTTAEGRFAVTMFAGLAEFERERILRRTGEGRQRAKGRGVSLGRPRRLNPAQEAFCRDTRLSLGEISAVLGVSRSTVIRARSRPGRQLRRAAEDSRQVDLEDVIAARPKGAADES
jgi:DNA invertase Pin-like site-specific DNA recombinase